MTADTFDWRAHAACRGANPDLFFPATGAGRTDAANAKHVCNTCPVRAHCLQAGLWEEHGIWGGLTEPQRRQARTTLPRDGRRSRTTLRSV